MRQMFLQKSKYSEMLRLAIPLIMASSGNTVMQFVDGVFLAHHSDVEIAAAGSASVFCWLSMAIIFGTVTYTSAMVSNLYGAKKMERIGTAVWQGFYLALLGGAITAVISLFCEMIFRGAGHDAELVAKETIYCRINLCGCLFPLAQMAFSGFFSGRGDNTRLMVAQVAGQITNIVGDYVLIFGKFGFPEWGIAGAALATVAGAVVTLAVLLSMMMTRKNRQTYATARNWRPDFQLMRRLCGFGIPNGVGYFVDAMIWTMFLMLMGRFGAIELAAATICFRMNSIAILPTLGIGNAEGTLVGQSHGRGDDGEAMRYAGHGSVLCFAWMTSIALTYVLFPTFYIHLFIGEDTASGPELIAMGTHFIHFVALYCTMDSLNVSLGSALNSVGDTKFGCKLVGSCSVLFCVAMLCAIGFWNAGATTIWTLVTIYVMILPIFWFWRLRSGRWKGRVVG